MIHSNSPRYWRFVGNLRRRYACATPLMSGCGWSSQRAPQGDSEDSGGAVGGGVVGEGLRQRVAVSGRVAEDARPAQSRWFFCRRVVCSEDSSTRRRLPALESALSIGQCNASVGRGESRNRFVDRRDRAIALPCRLPMGLPHAHRIGGGESCIGPSSVGEQHPGARGSNAHLHMACEHAAEEVDPIRRWSKSDFKGIVCRFKGLHFGQSMVREPGWRRRPIRMTKSCSNDLREQAVASVRAGGVWIRMVLFPDQG